MEGIDFAFYQGRSKYHTKLDSIPGAGGAKRSLWAMMEAVRGAGMAMLNEDRIHVGSDQPVAPVYFDRELSEHFPSFVQCLNLNCSFWPGVRGSHTTFALPL